MKQLLSALMLILTLLAMQLLPQDSGCQQAFIWGAVLAAIPAVISLFKGNKQKKEGEQMVAANERPILSQTSQFEDMLQFYEKQAQYGLDANSLSWQLDQNNRALTTSLNTMVQAGADPNAVSTLYGNYADNISKTAAADSQARWNKVQVTANAMQQLINEQEKEFLYNEDAPYKDTAQLAAAKQQAGEATINQSVDSLFGNLAKSLNNNYQTNDWATSLVNAFKKQYTPTATTAPAAPETVAIGPPPGSTWTDADQKMRVEQSPAQQQTNTAAVTQAMDLLKQLFSSGVPSYSTN